MVGASVHRCSVAFGLARHDGGGRDLRPGNGAEGAGGGLGPPGHRRRRMDAGGPPSTGAVWLGRAPAHSEQQRPLAMDVTRVARLRSHGYRVHTQLIPAEITPKNRLLLAEPEQLDQSETTITQHP